MAHALGAGARPTPRPRRPSASRDFADQRALGRALAAALAPGDVVLVKGSRGRRWTRR